MAERTEHTGLIRLEPGEPVSTDGYALQSENPIITDRLLRVGTTTHHHDGHAALADPTDQPSIEVANEDGHIASGLTLYVGYTLLDADGLETALSPTTVADTGQGLVPVSSAPELTVGHDSGALLADTYAYAVSVTDDTGGQTALGPVIEMEIVSGFENSRITISGLQSIVEDSGGLGWRLYRSVGGGSWVMAAQGITDDLVDDGTLCVDCGAPPTGPTNTSKATHTLTVDFPVETDDGNAVARLYVSLDGSFESPCYVGEYAEGDSITLIDLDLLDGSPPSVSTTVAGAAQINPETEILNFTWRRPVAQWTDLPATGNRDGDGRLVIATKQLALFSVADGDWSPVGGGGGGGGGSAFSQIVTNWSDLQRGTQYGQAAVVLNDQGPPTIAIWMHFGGVDAWQGLRDLQGSGGGGGGGALTFEDGSGANLGSFDTVKIGSGLKIEGAPFPEFGTVVISIPAAGAAGGVGAWRDIPAAGGIRADPDTDPDAGPVFYGPQMMLDSDGFVNLRGFFNGTNALGGAQQFAQVPELFRPPQETRQVAMRHDDAPAPFIALPTGELLYGATNDNLPNYIDGLRYPSGIGAQKTEVPGSDNDDFTPDPSDPWYTYQSDEDFGLFHVAGSGVFGFGSQGEQVKLTAPLPRNPYEGGGWMVNQNDIQHVRYTVLDGPHAGNTGELMYDNTGSAIISQGSYTVEVGPLGLEIHFSLGAASSGGHVRITFDVAAHGYITT